MTAWSDLTGFVSRNKTAAIVTATILAAGTGIGIYYALNLIENDGLTSTSEAGVDKKGRESPIASSATTASGDKKKSKKKSKKNKSASSSSASSAATANDDSSTSGEIAGFPLTRDSPASPEYPVIKDYALLEPLSKEDKKKLAVSFKTAGNAAFGSKKYERAIELYSDAIRCDSTDPIFYSNRAACYNAQQEYEKVVEDTTKALEIDPDYIKCLSRRAVAYEKLENYAESIMDFTASCILGGFRDKSLNDAVDRVLKLNSEKISREKYENRPKTLPSSNFISAYLHSFRKRKLPESLEKDVAEGSGDYDLKLAFNALDQETPESYEQAFQLFKSAVDKKADNLALAYEYTGTFKFLINEVDEALDDIEKSINLQPTVQAYIKRSSIHMERGSLNSANLDFEGALKLDPDSADVYYHRAQIAFLTSDFNAAIKDYKKSISLDPDFMYSHIQLAVSQYRMGSTSDAINSFRDLLSKYSQSSDVHNYYGEVLLDQGSMPEALKEFDIAIELEKKKKVGSINVLPLVNKALAIFQANQDVAEAESLCRKAVTIDPLSDVAIGTLAQFCLQMNKTEEALKLFERNAEISRTEAERVQSLSFATAAQTQLRIMKEKPALRQHLELITQQGRV